jgi:hypothetical protein
MPRLGLLLVIVAVANVITALAALFVAVQVWRVDITNGNVWVNLDSISGSVPVHTQPEQALDVKIVDR